MSDPKSDNSPASMPDQLVNSGRSAINELSKQELDGVTGSVLFGYEATIRVTGIATSTPKVTGVSTPTIHVPGLH
jgi:hypothetical protein